MIKQKNTFSVSFSTLGCRLNQAETAVIQNNFQHGAYRVVRFTEPADIVVINTCTVTENGDTDTRRLVNKAVRLNPQARIALIGCQAQIQKEKLLDLPNVQWVVGNAKKFDLSSIVQDRIASAQPQVITPTISKKDFTMPIMGIDTLHTRANLKIQDGCDFFCSFCEIPYARGRARSRQFSDILKDAETLVESGHQELVLTGINIGTYKNKHKNIIDVITALEQISKLKRIRISSIEPTTIPETLLEKMCKSTKLCRHLHIPLQSGSNSILKKMHRKYTTDEFCAFINRYDEMIPNLCIGTDIIVGFPGETDKDFEQTLNVVKDSPIHYFHVFSYSSRFLAKSKDFEKEVPKKNIQQRSQILRDLGQRKRHLFYKRLIGQTVSVLFEQTKNGFWTGLTNNYVRVNVKSNQNLSNTIRPVKLNHLMNQAIIGDLMETSA